MEFAFEAWSQREDHEGLRDAWIASRDFGAGRDWSASTVVCNLCGGPTPLTLATGADPSDPDTRESVLCSRCRCNARIRAALGLLIERLPRSGKPSIYVTEQVTPTFVWMQQHLDARLHGSEYEPSPEKRQVLSGHLQQMGGHGPVAFQDVTRLDFRDGSLDAVVSFEVLEHVPDYRAAIGEFARVLKPGGFCIATFPFIDVPQTLVRARVDRDGGIEHLLPPEYHGDPIGGGILCFYHFGWDVLDLFREAGFRHVRMVMPWSLEHGLLYGLWTLVAEK